MKLNINKQSLTFIARYYAASKAQGRHSLARMLSFSLNICVRPVYTYYYPEILKVEITRACNMSCSFCGAARSFRGEENMRVQHMSLQTLSKILDNMSVIRWIDLQGVGEPLMHPLFSDIMNLLNKRKISVQLTTNGTLINDIVLKTISECIVHSITVSISASSAKKYMELHGSDSYELVLENVSRIVRIKKEGKPKIRLLTVVMSNNIYELNGLIDKAKVLGADSLVLSSYKSICDNDLNIPDHKALSREVRGARAYAQKVGMPLEVEVPIADVDTPPNTRGISSCKCLWPWTSLAVNIDGEVMPCCYSMGNRTFSLGNLANESVYSIFNSPQYRTIRSALNLGKTKDLLCHFCNDHVG